MNEVLKKFGRYFLLDRVAQGGMAEIYRARLAATTGPSRLLVIKRIQQGFGSNAEFIQMFKSETQVTMAFNHPNIVQVYDFGEEKEQPYIAMEFVDGKNLRQILLKSAERKQPLPVELVAYLIEQAAAGLYYAHTFKDKISGASLNIVHRDVSPQNILVSFEGGVKVIDFGIAKASTNGEATRAGIIKGKLNYLSPEQISGDKLDGRCDIFSLGSVLWELLTGKKLFAAEGDLAVLKMIEACATHVKPPSAFNSAVPRELDYIVLKALAKGRDQRYQNADDMRRALQRFIQANNPDFNPSDLGFFVKDLFKDQIVEDRKRVQKLNERAEQLLALGSDTTDVRSPFSRNQKDDQETTSVFQPASVAMQARFEAISGTAVPVVPGTAAPPGPSSSVEMAPPMATAMIDVDQKVGADQKTGLKRNESGGTSVSSGSRSRKGAWVSSETRSVTNRISTVKGEGRHRSLWIAIVVVAATIFGAPLVGVKLPSFSSENPVTIGGPMANGGRSGASAAGSLKAVSKKKSPGKAVPSVKLRLAVTPFSGGEMIASVNGKSFDAGSSSLTVALDEPLELVVSRDGFRAFRREFVLNSRDLEGRSEYVMELALEPMQFGFLTIRTTPSSDAYLSPRDGTRTPSSEPPLVRRTPFENEKFPVGTYNVKLVNEVLGMEKIVTVTVQEGRAITIDERLEIRR